ncbi:hypothetical protein [Paracoccus ravus]|uniref:hypothetical protein n=1 Tax=Paracoccus ravus TaxID=2447760 RepID=UPI00106E9AA9|nr:hypothetical protein [Paracoccus ravus]
MTFHRQPAKEPPTDTWVWRILSDPTKVRHLADPLLADLEGVLTARLTPPHEIDPCACRDLIAALLFVEQGYLHALAKDRPLTARDWRNAAEWLAVLGFEVEESDILGWINATPRAVRKKSKSRKCTTLSN